MKIQIEFSGIEEKARNKILYDIGNVFDKDIMNLFMDYTEKRIKADFGSLYLTEQLLILNLNPKCFVEFADYINQHIRPGLAGLIYAKYIATVVTQSLQAFNEKWEVINYENSNDIK